MRVPPSLAAPLIGVALAVFGAGPAAAADGSRPTGELKVNLAITDFKQKAGRTTAQGMATATLLDNAGNTTKIRQPVSFAVKAGGSCRILSLVLDELDLRLLGLNVHLDKVNLSLTGRRRGGVLGNLFCKLASSRVKLRAAAVKQLDAVAERKPIRPLAFTVPLRAVAAQSQTPTCQVLSLVLGPLNLELLGLVVDLDKVNLNITATPGQGALGDLFCQLANNNQSGQPSG
jgi:hypothetical protein